MSNNPFTLTLLGTASAMPVKGRNQSAQALNVHGRLFLIDCGEGTQYRMVEERVPMMKLDSIFLSHIHGDHVFGIFGLLSTLGMKGRQTPLNIFAPVNFGPILKFFLSYYGDGLAFEIRFTPLKMKEPETILETKSIAVQAFPLNHGIETFGFRFAEKEPPFNVYKEAIEQYSLTLTEIGTLKRGEDIIRADGSVIPASEAAYKPFVPRSYAYISDTAPFPELAAWLKGVTTLCGGSRMAARHHRHLSRGYLCTGICRPGCPAASFHHAPGRAGGPGCRRREAAYRPLFFPQQRGKNV